MTLRPTVLSLAGHSLPPSLPLIVERDYEWDWEKSQLVECQDKTTGPPLKVVQEALKILSSIDKPIAVLSICGPYRTGKSYLLSCILGSPSTFEVGHSMNACTKGVWMSTTILERDDLAVVLLDTEGMDSIDGDDDASKTDFINKILMVTTVLSSLLIYNSKSVPEWSDLEDLSCFSQLSSSILSKSTEEYDNIATNFPDFLWLIRDAFLQLPAENGRTITPTEYLMRKVLCRSENAKPTTEDYVVSAILRLFPSIKCQTLPRPSADPQIVTSLVKNQDRLDERFKMELQSLIDYVKENVKVKSLCGRDCSNGTVWGELVTKFVELVSRDDELALTSTYVTAAESALVKLSLKLVEEYKQEMEKCLKGKYPLEEYSNNIGDGETLLSIHKRVLDPKQQKFESQVSYLLSVSGEDDLSVQKKKENAISSFINEVCKLSSEEPVRIEGGALHRFAMENHKASRRYCYELSLRAFRNVREAIQTSRTDDELSKVLIAAEEEYTAKAVGPAKDEVYLEVRQELTDSSKVMATTIPGRPVQVRATGMSKNKIKLQWMGTGCKQETKYEVQLMYGHENWTLVPDRFTEEFGVIESLKSNTDYLFQVRGVGKTGRYGDWSDTCECSTTLGAMARGAATVGTFMGGLVSAPVGATVAMPIFGPLSTLGGLASAPIIAGMWAKKIHERFGPQGELKGSNATVSDPGSVSSVAETDNSSLTDSAGSDGVLDEDLEKQMH